MVALVAGDGDENNYGTPELEVTICGVGFGFSIESFVCDWVVLEFSDLYKEKSIFFIELCVSLMR